MKKFGRAEIGQIAGMFRRGGTRFYFKSQLGKSRHLHVPYIGLPSSCFWLFWEYRLKPRKYMCSSRFRVGTREQLSMDGWVKRAGSLDYLSQVGTLKPVQADAESFPKTVSPIHHRRRRVHTVVACGTLNE